ncbi:LysR family transcriptional regulator, partial [Escherichia coli]|nr:LysR family transcriptional regulator [Escherichia coli]
MQEATSSRVEARLAELGHALPAVAKPVAAYLPAVTSGNYVYT